MLKNGVCLKMSYKNYPDFVLEEKTRERREHEKEMEVLSQRVRESGQRLHETLEGYSKYLEELEKKKNPPKSQFEIMIGKMIDKIKKNKIVAWCLEPVDLTPLVKLYLAIVVIVFIVKLFKMIVTEFS